MHTLRAPVMLALNDEGCYETGYVPDAQTRTTRVQYDNAIDACAAFIKHEIESIQSGKGRLTECRTNVNGRELGD
jgi:hypothetical protein